MESRRYAARRWPNRGIAGTVCVYAGKVFVPDPMGAGQPAAAVGLAETARLGRLAIYTGAGLSPSQPTDIPDGAEVARRCYASLAEALGPEALDGALESDLTSVADKVALLDGGLDLVRRTAVRVADFTSARPNFSHAVLAPLMLEGAVVAITTNWDDCIERAGGEERVLAVISDQDRHEIQTVALLKVHGCATRPTTALITTQDLTNPPAWARARSHAVGWATTFAAVAVTTACLGFTAGAGSVACVAAGAWIVYMASASATALTAKDKSARNILTAPLRPIATGVVCGATFGRGCGLAAIQGAKPGFPVWSR